MCFGTIPCANELDTPRMIWLRLIPGIENCATCRRLARRVRLILLLALNDRAHQFDNAIVKQSCSLGRFIEKQVNFHMSVP